MTPHQTCPLNDLELLTAMQILIKKDYEANAKLIRYLKETEQRELHLRKGCETLELFCEVHLGLTENQARARVRAMRLTYAVPLAEEKIRRGELSLSVAALAQRSFAQAERTGMPVTAKEKAAIVDSLDHCSVRQAARVLAETVGGPAPPEEKRTPYAGGTTRLEFTASARLMQNLERLQELLAHKNFGGRLDYLFETISEIALKEVEKKKGAKAGDECGASKGAGADTAAAADACTETEKNTRHIPVEARREAWLSGGGACQFLDTETGQICGSKNWVQVDHILPFSEGGTHDVANLRLLCGAHNRYAYERYRAGEKTDHAAGGRAGPGTTTAAATS